MKIVIDIDEEQYLKILKDPFLNDGVYKAIKTGTTLDDLRAEIDDQYKWLLKAECDVYKIDIAFGAIKAALAERSE